MGGTKEMECRSSNGLCMAIVDKIPQWIISLHHHYEYRCTVISLLQLRPSGVVGMSLQHAPDAQFILIGCKTLRTCKPLCALWINRASIFIVVHAALTPTTTAWSELQQPAVMCIWYEGAYLKFNYPNLHLFSPLNNATHRIVSLH